MSHRKTPAEQGYDGRWRRASKAFLAAHPHCVDCGRAATLVDHEPAHRGDMRAFWDSSTWRPMCLPCHSSKTNRHDGGFGNPRRAMGATA